MHSLEPQKHHRPRVFRIHKVPNSSVIGMHGRSICLASEGIEMAFPGALFEILLTMKS